MGKKGHNKAQKKKLTKKEKKAQSHLKLVQSKKSRSTEQVEVEKNKKAA